MLPLEICDGKWGPQATLSGAWSSAVEESIRRQGIQELELNHAKGWRGQDVAFLERLPNLAALTIIDHVIPDVGGIHTLEKLRYLDVNTYCRTPVDFGCFPLLEECALEWRPKSESLFAHAGLKRIFVNNCPIKTLEPLSNMADLQSLSLASPKLQNLKGIERLQCLTFLGVYVARSLASLDGLQALSGLVQLEVNDCRKVTNLAPIAGLLKLRKLHVCNDGDIESFKPLADLKELEQVLFYESTNVLDGDLGPLKRLPKLKDVAFMERKHYTHTRADFPA